MKLDMNMKMDMDDRSGIRDLDIEHGRARGNVDMETWTKTWRHGRGYVDMDEDMGTWRRDLDMETRHGHGD